MCDAGRPIAFTFADLLRYHGPGSPGGVAQAYKVLERALPLLGPDAPVERREVTVGTPFGGPGARDAFECVLRAVTGDRYRVDVALTRPELGSTRERFVFVLAYRSRAVELALRAGFVTQEFLDLVAVAGRTTEQEAHLARLKLEFADRLMTSAPVDVYDASCVSGR